MSKSTLSTLKGEINTESRYMSSTCSTLSALDKSILSAMDDRVGRSASESIKSIEKTLYYNLEKGYKSANSAISALETGYGKLDSLSCQGEKHLSQAKSIVKGLGEI